MEKICTVLLISYNHEKYIEKAINSVLEQETEYPFIIKICDDCSTDGSQEIIKSYAAKYPDLVEAHINETNQGAQANIWNAYRLVDTRYCAVLECDDYWCDKNKLQLQISALEKHPECSFSAHNTIIKNCGDNLRKSEHGSLCVNNRKLKKKDSIIKLKQLNLFSHNYMNHNSSRVIRMSCIDLNNITHKEAFLYDNAQFYYLLSKGDLYYIPRIMSVYDETGLGTFSGNKNAYKRLRTHINSLLQLEDELGTTISRHVYKEIFYFIAYYRWLIQDNIEIEDKKNFIKDKLRRFYYIIKAYVS